LTEGDNSVTRVSNTDEEMHVAEGMREGGEQVQGRRHSEETQSLLKKSKEDDDA
jgi:hypothetical protein